MACRPCGPHGHFGQRHDLRITSYNVDIGGEDSRQQPKQPPTNNDFTAQEHRPPKQHHTLPAQLHLQVTGRHREFVLANLLTLLNSDAASADIVCLQDWGEPETGCSPINRATALGPQVTDTEDMSKSSAVERHSVELDRHAHTPVIITAFCLAIESLV
jgi:hypothetical protein